MFEVGRLVARIQIEGKASARADLGDVEASFEKATTAARKHSGAQDAAGTAITGTGKRARAAATELDAASKSTTGFGTATTATATAAAALGGRVQDAAAKVDTLSAAQERSGAAAKNAADKASRASDAVEDARGREATAAGRVRVAEKALADVRETSAEGSAKVIRAEETLAAANRQHEAAKRSLTAAERASAAASEQAATALEAAGRAAQTATPQVRSIRQEFAGLSDSGRQAAGEVGGSMLRMGAGITAFAALSIARFADYDRAMSGVAAATLAPQSEIKQLRDATLALGADTKFSATQAAQGVTELAKAGVSTAAILEGGLAGSLSLAAAGELEVADAAEIAATAMTQFKLTGDQIPHVADLLAAGAGKAQGSVADLSGALNQSGLVAAQMGLSIEETTGGLALFAKAGLVGSDAGTSLKTMLLQLANPSAEADALMKQLGIDAYDTAGNFVGLEGVAGQLTTAFEGKTQAEKDSALATIFGSDAIRSASVLYEAGAAGVAEWTAKVNDAGFAARTAAELQNNLAGDVEKLGGAFDTALIQSGSGANDVLREMVQQVTSLVDWFGALPAPVISSGLAVTGAVGGFLLLGGTILTTASKIGDLRLNLVKLNEEMPRTSKAATGMTKALGLIAGLHIAVSVLAQIGPTSIEAAAGLEETARAAKSLEGLDDLFADLHTQDVVDLGSALELAIGDSSAAKAERFGSAINEIGFGGSLPDQVKTTGEQFANLDTTLSSLVQGGNPDEAAEQFARIQSAAEEQGISVEKLNGLFPQYSDALIGLEDPTSTAAEGAQTAAEAYLEQADGVQKAVDQLNLLLTAINELNAQNQSAIEANVGYQESLASTQEQIAGVNAGTEGYGRTLDITTEAGRSNTGVLLEQAKSAQEAAYKQYDLDVKTMGAKAAGDKLKATLEAGKATLQANATELSGNADEAQGFTDKVFAIPSSKDFDLITNTAEEIAKANAFAESIRNIPGRRDVVINQVVQQTGAPRGQVAAAYGNNGMVRRAFEDGGTVKAFANGGEHHVAQVARAGEWRVWAEDETGGETYIPWHPSKRKRSTEILAYTADGFGFDLVPKGTQYHANGSTPIRIDPIRGDGSRDIVVNYNGLRILLGVLHETATDAAEIVINEQIGTVFRDVRKGRKR